MFLLCTRQRHRKSIRKLRIILASYCCIVTIFFPHTAFSQTSHYGQPLAGSITVLGYFHPGKHRWDSGRRGVQLRARLGQQVYASGDGTISYRGKVAGIHVIVIHHKAGFDTTYEPVVSQKRHFGEYVHTGDPIGTITRRLCDTSCLKWGAKIGHGHGSIYFDPLILLGRASTFLYDHAVHTPYIP